MKKLLLIPSGLMLVAVLVTGCGESSTTKKTGDTNAASATTPASAPADYLGAMGKAQKSAEKVSDVASINQAIQAFKAENDRNPKDLNELVQEKYLPRIPDAPYGMKFTYDPATGVVKAVREQ